jgi:hypothetical protein
MRQAERNILHEESEHDSTANGNGLSAQRRVQQLLDLCIERIKVRMENGHRPELPREGWDVPLGL